MLVWLIPMSFCWGPAGRAAPPRHAEPERPLVVATVGMTADLARQIGGDLIRVEGLMGEGIDPHLYTPTRRDVILLQQADLVVAIGLSLEGRMNDVLNRMRQRNRKVVFLGDSLRSMGLLPELPSGLGHDPHIWMNPKIWKDAAFLLGESLTALVPDHREAIAQRVQDYARQLEALDSYIRTIIDTIPIDQRILVTAHDAFQYFGTAYGIEVRGIQGLSTESEAGLRDIQELLTFLVSRNVPAVFVETSVSEKNVRALLEGAGSRRHFLRVGGMLFSDAMGPSGTYEGTVIGMLDHNATTIVRSLGGKAPADGWRGWQGECG